ncbi:MAG: Gfo/Idh/MocA family oxidoreductase [Pirellulales bacterium]
MNNPSHRSTRPSNRRDFVRTGLAAAAGLFTAPAILRGQNLNSKLDVAIIGTGGSGAYKMELIGSTENIVAICDVAQTSLERARTKFPQAREFTDFRKLYEQPGLFDAVVVSTCEHTHALATLPALKLGKHVFCEKPLAYNVWETRVVREAAAQAKVATQMGTQIHASENYRQVVELIQSHAIGPVSEVHVWVGRAWGRQSTEAAERNHDIVRVQERPQDSTPIPQGLDWDLWLGPAPYRPFHEVYYPGPKWYRWWDFGNGTMSDLGSHWNDLPFWALNLHAPLTVESFGPPPHAEIAPASMRAVYEYGARDQLPPVRLTWYQGEEKPDVWKQQAIPTWDSGVLFVGTDGRMLLADYDKHLLLPEDRFRDFQRPEPYIPRSIGHYAEWLQACKTGAPTTCNFEYAGWLTEANHLGNVAYRTGQKIAWDSAAMRVTNTHDADQFLRRTYRDGWQLPV